MKLFFFSNYQFMSSAFYCVAYKAFKYVAYKVIIIKYQ